MQHVHVCACLWMNVCALTGGLRVCTQVHEGVCVPTCVPGVYIHTCLCTCIGVCICACACEHRGMCMHVSLCVSEHVKECVLVSVSVRGVSVLQVGGCTCECLHV